MVEYGIVWYMVYLHSAQNHGPDALDFGIAATVIWALGNFRCHGGLVLVMVTGSLGV